MKDRAACFVLLSVLSIAAIADDAFSGAIRMIDGKQTDFTKIVEWANDWDKYNQAATYSNGKKHDSSFDDLERHAKPANPLWPKYIIPECQVLQVLKEGLLLEALNLRGETIGEPFFVKNHPLQATLVDGKQLKRFLARPIGRKTYNTTFGSKTVEAFDHGTIVRD